MIVNAVLDFFSVAAFLPLIILIVKPDFIENYEVTSNAYELFSFASPKQFIVVLTAGVFLLLLIKILINSLITKVRIKFAFDIAHHLSSRIIEGYIRMPFSKFPQTDFTRTLNQIINHPLSFANSILIPVTTLICEILIVFFFLAWMALYDFKMLFLLCVILFSAVVTYQFGKKHLLRIGTALKETYRTTMKAALQIIEAFPEIKVYGKESFFLQKFQRDSRDLSLISIRDKSLQATTTRMTELIVGFLICSIIIYTVYVQEDYQQTLLLLAVYIGASFRIIPSANRILFALQQLRMHSHLLDDLKVDFFETPAVVPTTLTFNHSISFEKVSFRYQDGPVALNDISFTIRKGEKIAITGDSGEGKTTLLLVLMRLLKESEGRILVDGSVPVDETGWRRFLGYVPQNPYIIDGTLCENIAFGVSVSEIDRSEILRILDDLGMSDLVRQLPEGIDSRIGERGAKLSGGQRQRIALARALYANAEIIILDEATNQVHASLELEIMDLLNNNPSEKKTIIMVTHKVQTNFYDNVYYLHKGRLANLAEEKLVNSSMSLNA
jgi:ABC-type multidrug transport system fused ATPase/permease subunit